MKIDLGYTHTTQSSADITIDDAHYLNWCRERGYPASDENLLKDEDLIISYLNYDKQFLSELIGWGESDTTAFDIDFK